MQENPLGYYFENVPVKKKICAVKNDLLDK